MFYQPAFTYPVKGRCKVMTKQEYVEYVNTVHSFFEREGITNLTGTCGENIDEECPACEKIVGYEPYFSWQPCECCGTTLGGNRIHASGYNPTTKEIYCYEICTDCEYFAEYGQLDDTTMLEIEQ